MKSRIAGEALQFLESHRHGDINCLLVNDVDPTEQKLNFKDKMEDGNPKQMQIIC
jgi:hypothetical protein